ncbi:MAG: DEAD/DEAH box helicase [Acidobacteria bacterium]|nr:MAG: DEAD/DEAH box helicase [Acidobacteriota bacterium]
MERFVSRLCRDPRLAGHVVYRGLSPARPPRWDPGGPLPAGAEPALRGAGVERLYSHQREALDLAAGGRNVLLATPTASGKTLAYLLAYLAAREKDPEARALFIYPLKALARDQLEAVRAFLVPLGLEPDRAAAVYDGDTPDRERRRIRRRPPAVLITNPDMVHLGLAPYHESWSGWLARLRLIAIDEAHVYRGVFGAHVHHVLRRLMRLVRHEGGSVRLIAGSATIGAPEEFIRTLTGEPFEVIRDSGAPRPARHVLFLSPTMASPYTVATRVVARAVEAGHKTIAFTKARRITELMHRWLAESEPELARRVSPYRAGYLPEERREIERRLFSGELDGVISTSALEAGIDVGGLDVCVLVGYPGSLATAWQRIGRAGRSDRESLAVLVAMPDALDQYVVSHPEHFFSGEFERVVLDPGNESIAAAHLEAAAAERSLDLDDARFLQGEAGPERLRRLEREGRVLRQHDAERWFVLRRRPQRSISLRSAGIAYELVRASDGRRLGTLDEARVWFEGHPGAIYLHGGQSYRVLALEREERRVLLEPAQVDYFTQVYARKETEILSREEARSVGPATLARGRLRVTTFVEGYSKRRIFGQEEISRHPLEAPPLVLETHGFWFELPRETVVHLVQAEHHPAGALHAAEHALIGLFPLEAICDRWDLGGISYAQHPQLGGPAVFVYDGWPGGIGLAATGYDRAERLVARTRELVSGCPCEDGCPSCVHSPKCGSGNQPLDKEGAVRVLDLLLGAERLRPGGRAAEAAAEAALASHRSARHPGVRGGGPLPPGFFDARSDTPAPAGLEEAGWPPDLPPPSELLRPGEGRWIFFDVETLRGAEEVGGWGNIAGMGLALAVCLDAGTGRFRSYRESDADALVDELLGADRVVGFNIERFDLAVLAPYARADLSRVATLDLLRAIHARLGFRLSLAHLAAATLGIEKTANGLQSLEWVKQGRFDLIERYCRRDVLLTAALWAYGRRHGYVLFRSRRGEVGRIPVDW